MTEGACTTAATSIATGIDVRVASAPSGGPPTTWPIALAWLFIESTVARVGESRLRASQADSIGPLKAIAAPRSQTHARASQRLPTSARPATASTCAAAAIATGRPGARRRRVAAATGRWRARP